ncbi:MAG: type II toxin-antitoxin system HipA family toxin [Parvibaculum sp.]
MTDRSLIVLMNGEKAGVVTQDANGNLSFSYDEEWHDDERTPLSLSMPTSIATHENKAITCFMWGLLTDNEETLKKIGRDHQVSPRNPFALLSAIGHDCAGAVQFVRPEEVDFVEHGGGLTPISNAEIAAELQSLRQNRGGKNPNAQFSLAGAQPKVAYARVNGAWHVPSGRMATTHILKPSSVEHTGLIENEHFCLQLANRIGLPAAPSEIIRFGDETAIVSTRYDRGVDPLSDIKSLDKIVIDRIHQEDMCQALGYPPDKKYEKEGGPGIVKIMDVISGSNSPDFDRNRFMKSIILNFIIKGTDAHAKNYSIIHLNSQYRLSPLYDVASILPYKEYDTHDLRLSMRVGKHYKFEDIALRHWEAMARSARYSVDLIREELRSMIRNVPEVAHQLARDTLSSGLDHPVIGQLAEEIERRCISLQRFY